MGEEYRGNLRCGGRKQGRLPMRAVRWACQVFWRSAGPLFTLLMIVS